MLIDTHCHLDFKDFDVDRGIVINRAKEQGIELIINVGSNLEGTKMSIELAEQYDFIYASVGIHPYEADKIKEKDLEIFRKLADSKKVIAIGEIGIDYYKNISSQGNQKRLFTALLQLSKEKNLPIIVHNRDAHQDVLGILKDVIGASIKGVMHCFSGDEIFLKDCLSLGMFISFTCNLTFKNAGKLREIARLVPMDRLLLETDAPFLAPQIFRGRRNEPSFIRYLAEEIARIKVLSFKDIADITTANAKRLFGI